MSRAAAVVVLLLCVACSVPPPAPDASVTLATDAGTDTDAGDTCPNDPSPNLADSDQDGRGDVCDVCPDDALDRCDVATRWTALAVHGLTSCALSEAGRVRCVGNLVDPPGLSAMRFTALSLHAGTEACALRDDGDVLCFDAPGVLTTRGTSAVQVSSGDGVSCARHVDDSVTCWTRHRTFALGAAVVPSPRFTTVAAGLFAVCAGVTDGTVRCRRTNVGAADTEFVLTPPQPWSQLVTLGNEVCVLATSGSVWCAPFDTPQAEPARLDVSGVSELVAAKQPCGVLPNADGVTSELKCQYGALALPGRWRSMSVAAAESFVGMRACGVEAPDGGAGRLRCAADSASRFFEPGLLPDQLPALERAIVTRDQDAVCVRSTDGSWRCPSLARRDRDLTGLGEVRVTSRGGCGVTGDGVLRCWGASTPAPAGRVDSFDLNDDFGCAVSTDTGAVSCFGYAAPTPPVGSFRSVAVLGAGYLMRGGCALDAAGDVRCFGTDASPDWLAFTGRFTKLSCGGDFCCGVHPDGLAECWGNAAVAVPASLATTRVVELGADQEFACAVLESTELVCWGPRAPLVPAGSGFSELSVGGKLGVVCATHAADGPTCVGVYQLRR